MRRTFVEGLLFAVALYGAAFGGVLAASTAPADTCDPAYTAQCCACEPSNVAEPAPLPHLYLPSVQRSTPPMSAEYTPADPAATPEPDVELPLGDASQ